MRWTTKLLDDYAYAQVTDETGRVLYAYRRVDMYPFVEDALQGAVDDVEQQIRDAE